MRAGAASFTGHIAHFAFGVCAWIAFGAAVIAAIVGALILPGLARRRAWVTRCARLPFRLTGVRVTVRGLEKLPVGDCVVVANHASYLDGVLLQGYLPPRFSYVIKGEMGRIPVVSFLLRRIGSRFVERFEASGKSRDARQLVRAATAGESLAVFPEGTFVAEPGLGRFRVGAFVAAIRGELPVVPVVINGSRAILPAEKVLPRHGHLGIDILQPIDPSAAAFADSRRLAATARKRILAVLDEPDLQAAASR
jgi:1-acyl-sn-glycerol-3-phosphate acyltransferase